MSRELGLEGTRWSLEGKMDDTEGRNRLLDVLVIMSRQTNQSGVNV